MFRQETMNEVPGIGATRTASYRNVWASSNGINYLPGGGLIDGALSRDPKNTSDIDTLSAGVLMGKITASSKWAPSILGRILVAYTSGGTSLTVSPAEAVEIVRRVGTSGSLYCIGPPTTAGTVAKTAVTFSAVNTTTGVITVTSLGADKVLYSIVTPADGSEVVKSFVDAGDGVKVTFNGTDYDVQWPRVPLSGIVDPAQLLYYTNSDASLKTYIKSALNAVGPFIFTDNV